jgi:hypothetical protein
MHYLSRLDLRVRSRVLSSLVLLVLLVLLVWLVWPRLM